MENQLDEEAARRARWERRKQEMRRKKKRQELFRKAAIPGIVVLVVLFTVIILIGRGNRKDNAKADVVKTDTVKSVTDKTDEVKADADKTDRTDIEGSVLPVQAGIQINQAVNVDGSILEHQEEKTDEEETPLYVYSETEDTVRLGDDIVSNYAIFVEIENGTILAGKGEKTRIVPASMTKVLTLLVAVENIDNLEDKLSDKFEITNEIADYCLLNDCSNAGFERGEKVTLKDLLYAAILPSGADGALGLAYYVAGSQEDFVELMNEKLDELGLSKTAHFTNCVGIYEDNHYCTLYDLAVIMNAAVKNKTCREVLSAHTYTTSITEKHPEGILLSNWFLRRIEDKDAGGEVLCGKTGYVRQSEHCAVSYGIDKKGREYICVTANAAGKWRCIEDHAYLYKEFSVS